MHRTRVEAAIGYLGDRLRLFERLLFWSGLAFLAFGLAGCAARMGPSTIPKARFNYNDKIAHSQNDQLLLNLVRLRYRDTPVFLDVGTVIAQYTLDARAGAAGRLNPDGGARSELGLDIGGSYSEQPTITYEPLKGTDFTRRLLTPLSPVNIILLSESGWSIERLLLCCVERINDIKNAPSASGPTPSRFPDNEDFRELAGLMRGLQSAGLLEFQSFVEGETRTARLHIDRPPPGAPMEATARRVREILRLGDQTEVFELTGRGLDRRPDQISIKGRSLLGALFFLSNGVTAPNVHMNQGLVTVTQGNTDERAGWEEVTGGLLKVSAAPSSPSQAFVRIRYRDHWFYIADSDLESKATFNLLTYLFSLQAAIGEGGGPTLTVPVGR